MNVRTLEKASPGKIRVCLGSLRLRWLSYWKAYCRYWWSVGETRRLLGRIVNAQWAGVGSVGCVRIRKSC
jgi:hypothetical protein